MKANRYVFYILFFLYSISAQAQPSINSSHMPQIGDTLRFSIGTIDTAVLQSFDLTGANLNWNFDSVVPLRQGVAEFINSSQSPYNVTGKIAEKLADTLEVGDFSLYDVYNFISNSSSKYEINQRGATVPLGPIDFKLSPTYSDPDEVYEFPLSYLDKDSNTFNFTFNNLFPPAYYSSSGYRVNEVEAWGTISTPYGNFNCIKVKTDIVSYDTVSFNNLNFGQDLHSREYKWISTQEAIPVFTLSGNVIAGTFIPTNVQFRDSVRNLPGIFTPVALFNADTTIVEVGESLRFNNLSFSLTGASYEWSISPSTFSFASGSSSVSEEPEVVFNDTGFYSIQLIATNGSGSDTLLRTNYIEVKQLKPIVDFEADTTRLFVGDTLQLQNLSSSPVAANYDWLITPTTFNFINGTNANSENPTLVFTDSASYDVRLNVNNVHGSSSLTRTDYIRADLEKPVANFTLGSTLVNLNDTITIMNLSTSKFPLTYTWEISPNNYNYVNGTDSSSFEPQLSFTDTAKFSIQLIVDNGSLMDTLNRIDYLEVKQGVSLWEYEEINEEINIYPIPVSRQEKLQINSSIQINEILIYDMSLKKIAEFELEDSNGSIDLSIIDQPGTYLLSIQTLKGILIKKIIIQ